MGEVLRARITGPAPATGAPRVSDRLHHVSSVSAINRNGITLQPRRCAGLTPREMEVLELLARGFSNKQICGELDISVGTVKAHVAGILEKLEVTTRVQAVIVAFRRNLLQSRKVAHGQNG